MHLEPSPWALVRRLRSAAALLLAAAAGCASVLGATPLTSSSSTPTTFHRIAIGSGHRTFLLHRPRRVYGPLPLLIVLHGSSANANVAMDESGLNEIADSVGALVAYVNGTGGIAYFRLFWNFEHCCRQPGRGADEASMVAGLVDSLAQHFPLDRRRIGVVGFSDAGTLAYSLACALPGVITTIGVIAGDAPRSACVPHPAVSTVVFHGTADRNIPFGNTVNSVADWAGREGCSAAPLVSSPAVVVHAFHQCHDGAEVALYELVGGNHGWPGGKRSWVLAPAPPSSVSASRIFAAFVLAHPRVSP